MRFTVLGSAGTHPGPGRVCSSYLVSHEGYRLLLDCGNGSLSNFMQVADVATIDAVLISHLHPDHFADLYGLNYALRFHPDGPSTVPVYGPGGCLYVVTRLLPSESVDRLALDFRAASAGDRLELGPFDVTLHAADHPIETLASRITADGVTVAYSADSAPTAALEDCARDADLFAADATWLERDAPHPKGIHMTGLEAGVAAARAGAARLLVTHVLPTLDAGEIAAEAAAAFDGEVLVANDLEEIEL